jgi:hypothetical protein
VKSFEASFYKHLEEDNTAGGGGVFGDAPSMGHGGALTPAIDFYAQHDARIPKGGKKKEKKKKNKKMDGSLDILIPVQRRPRSGL